MSLVIIAESVAAAVRRAGGPPTQLVEVHVPEDVASVSTPPRAPGDALRRGGHERASSYEVPMEHDVAGASRPQPVQPGGFRKVLEQSGPLEEVLGHDSRCSR